MLLTADIGNTNVVLGVFDDEGTPRGRVRVGTRRDATADEIAMTVAHLCREIAGQEKCIRRTILCSVVPSLTRTFAAFVEDQLAHSPTIISAELDLGIPVAVDDPREVGADRITNAIAARNLVGVPAIVVDLGTATNFDVLDPAGRYVGGVIAPGIETASEDLFRRAARLTKVDLSFPDSVVGSNTADCLRSGILNGAVGMIDTLVEAIWKELGQKGTVIATGGLAPLIGPRCRTIDSVDVGLTLNGLLAIDRHLRRGVDAGRA
ncbi:MAG: type III pantothenate kinase [Gemmatimonadota bacterium]|nr:MAG: type III pantothenate kinase [Gemmatimonadota bacterium]